MASNIKQRKISRNLITNLIIPIRISQFLGIFPLSISKNSWGQYKADFRLLSPAFVWNVVLTVIYSLQTSRKLNWWNNWIERDRSNFLKTVKILVTTFHHGTLQVFYIFFLARCRLLMEFYTSWNSIVPNLKYTKPQKKVYYFASVVSIFILAFGVWENTMFIYALHTTNMKDVGPYEPLLYVTDNMPLLSRLQKYFFVELSPPYNFIALIAIIMEQAMCAYMWNFMDALIIVHCGAIAFQFESLVETATEIVADSAPEKMSSLWEEIRCEFEQLCGLLRKWNAFISTPLLLSYILNILLMAMHFSQWISSKGVEGGQGMTIYAMITSYLLIIRMILVTHYGSKIHENAHGILSLVDKCSSSAYSISLERLERKLAAQWIGVNAGGIFFVSRSLFASLFSCIFTMEIFLLQAGQPSQSQSQSQSFPIGFGNGSTAHSNLS